MDGVGERDECGWVMKKKGGGGTGSEESQLELRLGPPAGEWHLKQRRGRREEEKSLLSLVISSKPVKRWFVDTEENQGNPTHKLSTSGAINHSSWTCPKAELQLQQEKQDGLVTAGSSPPAAVADHTQTRTTSAPVVGWPPIRSFRKNLASRSVKPPSTEAPKPLPKPAEIPENAYKGMFVKINMEGVPIGRKVDLNAYDGYEKLASAVDELFRDLLAAQRDPTSFTSQKTPDGSLAITGILGGTGEYTLVYEDEEGDRMLVGDDPWEMFVTTVKRLRVLKTSELTMLRRNRRIEKLELACGAT